MRPTWGHARGPMVHSLPPDDETVQWIVTSLMGHGGAEIRWTGPNPDSGVSFRITLNMLERHIDPAVTQYTLRVVGANVELLQVAIAHPWSLMTTPQSFWAQTLEAMVRELLARFEREALEHRVYGRWQPESEGEGTFHSFGPVLGWRTWSVASDGRLRGAWRMVWDLPYAEARCDALHPAPDWDCECGIYAYKKIQGGGWAAQGLVAMEGEVIEHEEGYRAERVTVLALAKESSGTSVPPSPGYAWRPVPVLSWDEIRRLSGWLTADPARTQRIVDSMKEKVRSEWLR